MSYGIIEPEAFTSMMALLQITSAEEAEGKFEDTPLQTAFEVEVLSYDEQDEDEGARIGHKFQDWASFKKDTRTGGIGIAYGGKLWNLIVATLGEECIHRFNKGGLELALARGSSQPHLVHRAFDPEEAQKLRDMLHRSPRNFGKDSSLWTLEMAAQVSFEQGLTKERVSGETIRATLARLGVRWRRAKRWITSPDPEYARKKGGATD